MFILFHAGVDRGFPTGAWDTETPRRVPESGSRALHDRCPPGRGRRLRGDGGVICWAGTSTLTTAFLLRQMPGTFREITSRNTPRTRRLFASTAHGWTGRRAPVLLQLPFLTDADKETICSSNAARLLGRK
jgi:hypothetical protein